MRALPLNPMPKKNEAHPSTSNTDHESTTSESNTKKNEVPPGPCSSKVQQMQPENPADAGLQKQHKFVSRNVSQLQFKLCKQ